MNVEVLQSENQRSDVTLLPPSYETANRNLSMNGRPRWTTKMVIILPPRAFLACVSTADSPLTSDDKLR